MSPVLDNELQTYEAHKEQLVGASEGKFVLIRETEIVGVYDSQPDALREGFERFGNVPFLVKQVVRVETPLNFISNSLAV